LKRAVCGVGAAVIGLSPVLASAACFTETEWRAAHGRILQSDLTVAGLECANVTGASHNDEYAAWVAQFQDRIKANGTILKAHFQRVYGGDWNRQLDIFVTKLANNASDRSMQDMKFCADAGTLFHQAMAVEKAQFEQVAVDRVTDHSEIGDECPAAPAKPAVQAAAKPPAAKEPPKAAAATGNAG